jgi:uncharacterized protein (TIGR02646 family)
MIKINKLPEPPGLRRFKEDAKRNRGKQDDEDKLHIKPYDKFSGLDVYKPAFVELRENLLKENRYVCAYCGKQVPNVLDPKSGAPRMKTEHFHPQNDSIENDLNYANLLGVCLGNQDSSAANHCDSSKGNQPFRAIQNPAENVNWAIWLTYRVSPENEEVTIRVKDNYEKAGDLKYDIESILNLNEAGLRRLRFAAWKTFVQHPLGSKWTKKRISEIQVSYKNPKEKIAPPFLHFLLSELDKRIRQAQG